MATDMLKCLGHCFIILLFMYSFIFFLVRLLENCQAAKLA